MPAYKSPAHRFIFAVRGLRLAGDRPAFYIKPADGFELPGIIKRLKQTFALGYNRDNGRTGRLWGDRYWSRIMEGETEGKRERRRRTTPRPAGTDTAANKGPFFERVCLTQQF
ncbi:MAG: hypothetical protein LBO04_06095 [Spirochaetaceae bacterium]|nr:hypothetical protein [Spirochaetaceae bacterium]